MRPITSEWPTIQPAGRKRPHKNWAAWASCWGSSSPRSRSRCTNRGAPSCFGVSFRWWNPEAMKFLAGMFQDLVDAHRGGKYIYLSTDEAYYIGMADNPACREKAAAQKLGSVGKLLGPFVTEIAEPLHQQGRTVIFWGEFPMVVADIASIPPYMVNGEVYGPEFDPVFHQRGIRQMIYTSTQGEER